MQHAQADRLLLAGVQAQAHRHEPLVIHLPARDLVVDVGLADAVNGGTRLSIGGDSAVLQLRASNVVDRAPVGDRRQPPSEIVDWFVALAGVLVQGVPCGVVRRVEIQRVRVQVGDRELAANRREHLSPQALIVLGDHLIKAIVTEAGHQNGVKSTATPTRRFTDTNHNNTPKSSAPL